MKKALYSILSTVAIVLSIIGGIIFYHLNQEIKPTLIDVTIDNYKIINYDANLDVMGSDIIDVILFEDQTLASLMKIRQKPLLILRLNEAHCNSCVSSILSVLESFREDFNTDLIILGSYASDRIMKTYLIKTEINAPYYNIGGKRVIDRWIEDVNSPFFILLQPDMSIQNVFIPEKEYEEGTISFLKKMDLYLNTKYELKKIATLDNKE